MVKYVFRMGLRNVNFVQSIVRPLLLFHEHDLELQRTLQILRILRILEQYPVQTPVLEIDQNLHLHSGDQLLRIHVIIVVGNAQRERF